MTQSETRAVDRQEEGRAEVTQSETRAMDRKLEGWGRGDTIRH